MFSQVGSAPRVMLTEHRNLPHRRHPNQQRLCKMPEKAAPKYLIAVCFLVTGVTGLVYEVVWTRMLILVFGSTLFAATTILTTFMAGFALGSVLFGRMVDKYGRPLLVYGLIALCLGLYCLATPLLFDGIRSVYLILFATRDTSYAAFSLPQFMLSFAGLIVPTTLMGGTLPVLVKYFTRTREKVGFNAGFLYAVNTLGAALGCFAAGAFLLYFLGLNETLYAAGGIDVMAGLLVLALHRSAGKDSGSRPPAAPPDERGADHRRAFVRPTVLVCFLLSGFAALVYEVLWFRLFSLVLGSSIYAFTIMLTTFLVGIAAGSALFAAVIDRRKDPVLWFAILEMAIGLSVLASIYFYRSLPVLFLELGHAFSQQFWLFIFFQTLLCALIMILPTLCLGATFPVVSRICGKNLGRIGRRIGDVYFVNTLGAIGGSVAGGFILIPVLGVQKAVLFTALLNLFIGLALLLISPAGKAARSALGGAAVLACVLLAAGAPPWDKSLMTIGPYIYPRSGEQIEDLKKGAPGDGDLIYYKEGLNAVLTVRRSPGGRMLSYQANGKNEGRAGDLARVSMAFPLLGHIPLLVHSAPQKALLIGLGAGITLGAMEQHPLREIDVVEIEAGVKEVAGFFAGANHDALNDQRVRLHVTDARTFLAAEDGRYDVIVSGVSDPWISGVANLFTREYFRQVEASLAENGVVALWFQNYKISTANLKTGLRTFAAVFPHVTAWADPRQPEDLIVIGTRHDPGLSLSRLSQKLRIETVRADLARMKIRSPFDVLSFFVAGERDLRVYFKGAAVNTDNRNILEFALPKGLYTADRIQNGRQRMKAILAGTKEIAPVPVPGERAASEAFYYGLGKAQLRFKNRRERARLFFEKVLALNPVHTGAARYTQWIQKAGRGTRGPPDFDIGQTTMDVTWLKRIDLEARPLDMAAAADGRMAFILAREEILLYTLPQGRLRGRIPLAEGYDRIASSRKQNTLLVTSASRKKLKTIRVTPIHEMALAGRPVVGPENASVTIALFSDYQCAPCARLEPVLAQVLQRYPEKVKLVAKQFPVLRRHRYARRAAAAALAADAQGRFRAFHERLFENQAALSDTKIEEIAQALGLDLPRFAADMRLPEVRGVIAGDVRDGRRAGVRGTPAVFINGKLLRDRSPGGIARGIEEELAKKG